MQVYHSIADTIGQTPLVQVPQVLLPEGFQGKILVKVEGMNPGGSVKDRVAAEIVRAAEEAGVLQAGGTIVEASSGNTGIGLALLGAAKGYRVVLTMPETMSQERRDFLRAYGAELVLTPGDQGMKGAIAKAQELAETLPKAFMARQFENTANPQAHYKTTGPEIWEASQGQVDVFVSGIGTGGTITGAGRYLKEEKEQVQVFAVEPTGSPVLSGGEPGPHKLQGIGAGFVPEILDQEIYDGILKVTDEDALAQAQALGRKMGVFAGITSGAALSAALELAQKPEHQDHTIVALLPDNGDRYLSVPGFIQEED